MSSYNGLWKGSRVVSSSEWYGLVRQSRVDTSFDTPKIRRDKASGILAR